jgi:hypothetical protein
MKPWDIGNKCKRLLCKLLLSFLTNVLIFALGSTITGYRLKMLRCRRLFLSKKRERLLLSQKIFFAILCTLTLSCGNIAYAEFEGCNVGDYSKGKWIYVNPDLSSNSAQTYCALPMDGPVVNRIMSANGYKATVSWEYDMRCDNSGRCPDGNFISTSGDELKTLEEHCQDMYYSSFQKKKSKVGSGHGK